MQVTELVRIIEYVEGRYDLEDVEFGRVYKCWKRCGRVYLRREDYPHPLRDHLR